MITCRAGDGNQGCRWVVGQFGSCSEGRHPEAPRFHQRGEGSGAQCCKLTHHLQVPGIGLPSLWKNLTSCHSEEREQRGICSFPWIVKNCRSLPLGFARGSTFGLGKDCSG